MTINEAKQIVDIVAREFKADLDTKPTDTNGNMIACVPCDFKGKKTVLWPDSRETLVGLLSEWIENYELAP